MHQAGWLNDVAPGLVGVEDSSVAWGGLRQRRRPRRPPDRVQLQIGAITKLYRNDGGGCADGHRHGLAAVYSVRWRGVTTTTTATSTSCSRAQYTRQSAASREGVPERRRRSFTDIAAGLTGVVSTARWRGATTTTTATSTSCSRGWTGFRHRCITKVYRNDGGGVFTDIGAGLTGVYAARWRGATTTTTATSTSCSRGTVPARTREDLPERRGRVHRHRAGLTGVEYGSVAWGDYDNDGDLDILLTGVAAPTPPYVTKMYRNDGGGVVHRHRAGPAGGRQVARWPGATTTTTATSTSLLTGDRSRRPKVYRNRWGRLHRHDLVSWTQGPLAAGGTTTATAISTSCSRAGTARPA